VTVSAQQPGPSGPPEKPSRYDRSFGGLLIAMVVCVVLVAGFIGVRALLRVNPDVSKDSVEYLPKVQELNDAGIDDVVYPPSIPPGWRATSVDYERGTPYLWGVGFVTADDEFVGIRQQKADLDDLLHTYVDAHPDQGKDVTIPSALGTTWQTWSDSGGDHAFVISDGTTGQTVMVYGSASVAEQEAFIATLTTDPLPAK
jgi:hypothetical protein